ncbi:hypothetical protein [Lactobacillus johnsonii]|uniref:hypothetical protein n=1 Tax=Lactobacillus johnsonii TaxID=33959 RepID=UPI00192A6704|nr:hypothetical protein [Lactobacillus johnsonii]TWU79279.1 hypothetical protein DLD91_01863 [Lactobacillus johnsonii]TWU79367.1 hypothetical protein DLD91_01952 [Lactobacillus johnsonii]
MTNNQKDFKQNIDAETTNLRPSSASEQSINHENSLNKSIATQQQEALSTYLQNHRLPDGVKFVDLEKLSNNVESLTDLVSDYDRQKLKSVLESGSKYGVMFIDDDNVAIHNISKKELTTLSKLKDYEFDPTYKAIAKDIAQLSPNVPDTVIDLGDSNSFNSDNFKDSFLFVNRNPIDLAGQNFQIDKNSQTNIVLTPTSIINGLEWNQRQDLYYYNPKEGQEPKLVGKDLESFTDYLNEPAKLDGFSTTPADINREAFAKSHQNQIKDIQKNLYTGRNNNASEDLFKSYLRKYDIYLNPSKRDFEDANVLFGFTKDANLQRVVEKEIESPKEEKIIGYISASSKPTKERGASKEKEAKQVLEEYGFKATDENIKKMTENIENEEKYNRQLHLKKSGLESVKLELSNPDIRKNYIDMYGNKTKLDKDTEKVFLEKPIYSQWFIQRDKAEKAYEDLEKLGFPRDYQSKESKRLDNLSRKISPATIHKLENAYVSTRNIYFDDETSEVKNVSLLSNNTKEKIERNGKKYLSQEHAKQVLKHKRLER